MAPNNGLNINAADRLSPELRKRMQSCPQNPRYHAEGDVLAHTELVLEQFRLQRPALDLNPSEERILYWACVLHDVGKPLVTREESGRLTAGGHEYAGVHIARTELIQNSDLSPEERRAVLDIVRWHYIPFRWGKAGRPFEEYIRLSYKTDLRLLAIFSSFDFNGRICENQESSVKLIEHFARKTEPEIRYHHGSFAERMKRFQQFSPLQKDAFWYALQREDFVLAQKLLQSDSTPAEVRYPNRIHLCWHAPNTDAEAWLAQHWSDLPVIRLSDFGLLPGDTDSFSLDRRTSELTWHLNVLSRHYPEMVLLGQLFEEPVWSRLTQICRRNRFVPEVLYLENGNPQRDYSQYIFGLNPEAIPDFHFMNPAAFSFHEIRQEVL